FLLQLRNAIVELLVARVVEADAGEVFGREAFDGRELHAGAGVERVANRKPTRVDDADDVAGTGFERRLTIAAEHPVRTRDTQGRLRSRVGDRHVLEQPTGADADEGHAVAVARVHVGLHLENEAAERW